MKLLPQHIGMGDSTDTTDTADASAAADSTPAITVTPENQVLMPSGPGPLGVGAWVLIGSIIIGASVVGYHYFRSL